MSAQSNSNDSEAKDTIKPGAKPNASKFLKFIKKTFNIRFWSDWNRTQGITLYLLNVIRYFFVPKNTKTDVSKTFEDVVVELKLTEAQLQSQAKSFRNLTIFMVCLAFTVYLYGMYQLIYGGVLGVILSGVLMLVTLALAFRYHFWYFQIKHRKLGCTIEEWFKESFMDGNQ